MKNEVEDFDIELDISDRYSIYDYGTCKRVNREEGKEWNLDEVRGLGGIAHVADDNENLMVQIKVMDKCIADKGFFQNKFEGQESDEPVLSSVFFDSETAASSCDLPPRALPVYYPGDVVKGNVVIKFATDVKPDHVSLDFVGQTYTLVRIYHDKGRYHDNVVTEDYVKERVTLWARHDGDEAKELNKQFVANLCAADNKAVIGDSLSAGIHRFPFEFAIPVTTAQSCPNLKPGSCNHAFIVYRTKAVINTGKFWGRGDVVTNRGIWVDKKIDVAADPENLRPTFGEETLDTGFLIKTGKIAVRCTVEKKGFVRGESVPVVIEVDNGSNGQIKKVSAFISLIGVYKQGDCRFLGGKVNLKGIKVSEANIASGMSPRFNWVLPFDFSESCIDSNLMPTGNLDDSRLVQVFYAVNVNVKRAALHRDISMQIPIFVGNFNSANIIE